MIDNIKRFDKFLILSAILKTACSMIRAKYKYTKRKTDIL